MFVFWCGNVCDVVDNWFSDMIFNISSCFFFCVVVDFIDYDDCFGLWIFFEYFQDIDEVGVWDWVVVDIDVGRLVEVVVGGLFNCFIGQGVGMGNDVYFIWFVNVIWYDVDFVFVWSDNVWVVWVDYMYVCFVQFYFYGQYIQCWDIFGDGDDKFNVCVDCFQDGIFVEWCWNVDYGCGCVGCFNGFVYGVEYWQVQVSGVVFVWCYVVNYLCIVSDCLFRVEGFLVIGEVLVDNFGIFID